MNSSRPQTPNPRPSELRSLITGISGFVGQYLARHLVDKDEEVSGIDLFPGSEVADYSVSKCDILDFERLKKITAECSPAFVYHLAGLVQPKDSLSRPRDYYLVNVQGTVNLLEALRQNDIDARILIVSSSKVYGKVPPEVDLIDETLDPKPQTPYAMSKYLAEQVAFQYSRNYGTQVLIARPFNHTGPGQPEGFVVPDFCKQIAEIEALPPEEQAKSKLHVGDLSPIRDFLDVRDVARAYEVIVKKGNASSIFNVCSGEGVSIKELLDLLLGVSSLKVVAETSAYSKCSAPLNNHIGDKGRLQAATGWKTKHPLGQTLKDTLACWEQTQCGKQRPQE